MFASKNLTVGQIEALVRLIGGADKVLQLLGNTVIKIAVILGARKSIRLESSAAVSLGGLEGAWLGSFMPDLPSGEVHPNFARILEFQLVNAGFVRVRSQRELFELLAEAEYCQPFGSPEDVYAAIAVLMEAGELADGFNLFPITIDGEERVVMCFRQGGGSRRWEIKYMARDFVPSVDSEKEGSHKLFVVPLFLPTRCPPEV